MFFEDLETVEAEHGFVIYCVMLFKKSLIFAIVFVQTRHTCFSDIYEDKSSKQALFACRKFQPMHCLSIPVYMLAWLESHTGGAIVF